MPTGPSDAHAAALPAKPCACGPNPSGDMPRPGRPLTQGAACATGTGGMIRRTRTISADSKGTAASTGDRLIFADAAAAGSAEQARPVALDLPVWVLQQLQEQSANPGLRFMYLLWCGGL
jgi:hypothetical protein